MHLEIERRFLVDKANFIFLDKKKCIKQAYLLFDDNTVLNIRKHTGFKISLTVQ